MKCPVDNVPLIMAERSEVEIDYCPNCRGVWLDRGELDKIIERSTASSTVVDKPASDRGYSDPSRRTRKPKKASSLSWRSFRFLTGHPEERGPNHSGLHRAMSVPPHEDSIHAERTDRRVRAFPRRLFQG